MAKRIETVLKLGFEFNEPLTIQNCITLINIPPQDNTPPSLPTISPLSTTQLWYVLIHSASEENEFFSLIIKIAPQENTYMYLFVPHKRYRPLGARIYRFS